MGHVAPLLAQFSPSKRPKEMKTLRSKVILVILFAGGFANGQDSVVGLETIGGIPTVTVVNERIGVFRFLKAADRSPIQELKIVYEIKETKLKRHFTSDEQGYSDLSIFWSQQSPLFFESPEADLPENTFIPEDVLTPLGSIKVRIKRKWIHVQFPHELQNESPVIMEFIDWSENNEEVKHELQSAEVSSAD